MRTPLLFSLTLCSCTALIPAAAALTPEDPARLVQPGQVVRLAVTDTQGGAAVRFELPATGPGGIFAGGGSVLEVQASAGGAAEAVFIAGNTLGPFLADATVVSTGESVSFAATVLDSAPPSVMAAQARALAEGMLGAGEILHGPVLLESGVEVRPGAPPVVFDHNAPFVATDRTWLAWIDMEPGSRFGHLARWIRIHAESSTVRTSYHQWWPELRFGSEQRPLLGAAWANRTASEGVEIPALPNGGAADACLVGILGDHLPSAKKDGADFAAFLAAQGLVGGDRVRLARSPASFTEALDLSVQSGCRTLYLLVSAHAGQARGRGVLLGGEYFRYAEMAESLMGFAEVEAFWATGAATEAAAWLHGRGLTGIVFADSEAEGTSPLNAVYRLVRSGGASLADAHAAGNPDRSIPEPLTIQPDGPRRFWLSAADIFDAGGTQRIDVMRPLNIDLGPTLIYNASVDDEDTAGFQTNVFVLPSDQDFLRFGFGGRRRGEAFFEIATNDSAQQIYRARGRVQIGSFTVSPDGVALRAGGRRTVSIQRHGYWNRRGAPAEFAVSSRDESIVQASVAGETFELIATGPGRTFVDIQDRTSGNAASVEVQVTGMQDLACPLEGSAAVTFAVASDPAGLAPRVALASGALFWKRTGSVIRLWGDKAPMISAEGMVTADCRFAATGASGQERVAGVVGLGAAYENGMIAGGSIAFDYHLTGFDGGGSVTFHGQGPAAAHNGLLGEGAVLVNQSGGERTLAVVVDDSTDWAAISDSDWIRPADHSGVGPAILRYLVTPNGTTAKRIGTLTAAGEVLAVTQTAGPDLGEPLVTGVINGANFQEGVASATWLTITGFNLSDETAVWFSESAGGAAQSGGPLPTELAGVSVAVNGLPAYVQFVSPQQINVLAPDDPTVGRIEVTVDKKGAVSSPIEIAKRAIAPELFRFQPREGRYPAAVHPDGALLGPERLFRTQTTRPANPGEIVLLFGAGFGPTEPPTPTRFLVVRPAPLAAPVAATIGGQPADVLFGGIVASGLYQFNVVVPEGLTPGDHLIELWSDGQPLETTAYLAVE